MSIEAKLSEELKNAMRAKNVDLIACIRQLKSKVQEAMNAPDFQGPADDAFYQRIITTYARSLEKGITELTAAGDRGAPLRAKYQAEITYLKQYLPQMLDEAATRQLVQETIATLAATSQKQAGQVMGSIMKNHKGKIDAGLVKRLVDAALPA